MTEPPSQPSEAQLFEVNLLKHHLVRLIEIDRQRVLNPDNINLQMDYDSTRTAINRSAATLGLGTYPDDLAAIVETAGLQPEYNAFLEHQRVEWQRRQRHVQMAEVSASPSDRVNISMELRGIKERIESIEQQQASLIARMPASNLITISKDKDPVTDQNAAQRRSLQKQLEDVEENIRLHEERMTGYVSETLIPLQLVKDLRGFKQKREQLIGKLDALSVLPSSPTESSTVEAGNRLNARMLPTHEVRLFLARADGVAMVSVGQFVHGQLREPRSTGTAWLIAPDLALTCWHVLHLRGAYDDRAKEQDIEMQAANCLLTFSFTEIGSGIDYRVTRIECANRNHSGLDYAVLRLSDRNDHPLRGRTPLPLAVEDPLAAISELHIIQHPRGMPQQSADGLFVQYVHQNTRMHYRINTAEGTSGSPVLLRPNWKVVALHHGATKDTQYGEGIALQPILADIRQQRPELYEEIMRTQLPKG